MWSLWRRSTAKSTSSLWSPKPTRSRWERETVSREGWGPSFFSLEQVSCGPSSWQHVAKLTTNGISELLCGVDSSFWLVEWMFVDQTVCNCSVGCVHVFMHLRIVTFLAVWHGHKYVKRHTDHVCTVVHGSPCAVCRCFPLTHTESYTLWIVSEARSGVCRPARSMSSCRCAPQVK